MPNDLKIRELATAVIETEIEAVRGLLPRIDQNFIQACHLLLHCQGRIIVTGMGKSGHIASKMASTLASTGSPAFFVHPGEASHGDLGMITRKDVVIAISNSGETLEILTILPILKRFHIPLITLCGNPQSTIAKASEVCLDVSVNKEACPFNLAPTASTTATLVMGDALAIALLEARGFTKEDFALSHPGGALGRRLLLRVSDLMHRGDAIPCVRPQVKMTQALLEMSAKRLGFTAIVDEQDHLLGIFTDGDLRRSLDKKVDIHSATIDSVMAKGGIRAHPHMLAEEALHIMEARKITMLPVVDQENHLVGALNIHDLLKAGVV